jgi:hypothetical protein
MSRRQLRRPAWCGFWLTLLAAQAAFAFGPQGHLAAGRAAEPLLRECAAAAVASLADGEDLGEVGLWADRVRSNPDYADSAPWHFMNIADGKSLAAFEHPPEGDVLWAIGEFSRRLSDPRSDTGARAEALRFLVHFVVDLHQPLHVGRADDRGGNSVPLRFRGEETNLHRLWDTQAIEWTGESLGDYTAGIVRLAARHREEPATDPLVWASESLDLRPRVYAFGAAGREPPRAYLDAAAAITRERLALAAHRLAGLLDRVLCE